MMKSNSLSEETTHSAESTTPGNNDNELLARLAAKLILTVMELDENGHVQRVTDRLLKAFIRTDCFRSCHSAVEVWLGDVTNEVKEAVAKEELVCFRKVVILVNYIMSHKLCLCALMHCCMAFQSKDVIKEITEIARKVNAALTELGKLDVKALQIVIKFYSRSNEIPWMYFESPTVVNPPEGASLGQKGRLRFVGGGYTTNINDDINTAVGQPKTSNRQYEDWSYYSDLNGKPLKSQPVSKHTYTIACRCAAAAGPVREDFTDEENESDADTDMDSLTGQTSGCEGNTQDLGDSDSSSEDEDSVGEENERENPTSSEIVQIVKDTHSEQDKTSV